jgi:hypothetical protein
MRREEVEVEELARVPLFAMILFAHSIDRISRHTNAVASD